MALYFNNAVLDGKTKNIMFNGSPVNQVVFNGVSVWQEYGTITYDVAGSYTLDIPAGVTRLKVCMIGGGGSGASGIYGTTSAYYTSGGGGFAGEIYSGYVDVTPNTTINIVVGSGGAASSGYKAGNNGTQSSVHTRVCSGGNGGGVGTYASPPVGAYGGNSTNCIGTFIGGGSVVNYSGNDYICYGGQAGFANGTSGAFGSSSSTTRGAGSGASSGTSGKGGDGYIIIEWGSEV